MLKVVVLDLWVVLMVLNVVLVTHSEVLVSLRSF